MRRLVETTRENDPRLARLDRRIAAIAARIAEERARLGSESAGAGGRTMSQVLADYEALLVDIEFAQGAYLAAMGQLDAARAEGAAAFRAIWPCMCSPPCRNRRNIPSACCWAC
ncbi:MAG: hypothetical protein KatS3mg118_0266 [Paracoccaceae bacterium]|nr:MAG: hypothetical protein KatS3mg118_0266 [Paracoccaceae bacterium]